MYIYEFPLIDTGLLIFSKKINLGLGFLGLIDSIFIGYKDCIFREKILHNLKPNHLLSTTMAIIGLCGRKRSGKNTVANILRTILEKEDFVVHEIAFADHLKTSVSTLCQYTEEAFQDDKKDTRMGGYKFTPRDMCLMLGDFARNKIDNNFFVNVVEKKVDEILSDEPNAVILITDVRFPVEAQFIKRYLDSVLVYIDADKRLGALEDGAHSSETSFKEILQKHNYIRIENNKHFSHIDGSLYEKVMSLYLRNLNPQL